MDVKTIFYLQTIQKYINILPTAALQMEEFILEPALKKPLYET